MANNDRPLWETFLRGAPVGSAKLDPLGNTRTNVFDSIVTSTAEEAKAIKQAYDNPVPVLLPRYTTAPEGAETLDMRRIAVLTAGEVFDLWSFTCPPGTTVVIYGYAMYTDAIANTDLQWLPTLDGRRILAYHGDPADNFKMNLALGIDMSQAALIPCQVFMQPGQVLSWRVSNLSTSQVSMGVRMTGYLDIGQRLTASKVGG